MNWLRHINYGWCPLGITHKGPKSLAFQPRSSSDDLRNDHEPRWGGNGNWGKASSPFSVLCSQLSSSWWNRWSFSYWEKLGSHRILLQVLVGLYPLEQKNLIIIMFYLQKMAGWYSKISINTSRDQTTSSSIIIKQHKSTPTNCLASTCIHPVGTSFLSRTSMHPPQICQGHPNVLQNDLTSVYNCEELEILPLI